MLYVWVSRIKALICVCCVQHWRHLCCKTGLNSKKTIFWVKYSSINLELSLYVIIRLWNVGKIDTYLIQSYQCNLCATHIVAPHCKTFGLTISWEREREREREREGGIWYFFLLNSKTGLNSRRPYLEYIPLSIYKLSLDVIFRLWNIGKIDTYLIQSYRCYFCTCHEKASTTNKEIQSTGSHSSFILFCIIRCETVKAWKKNEKNFRRHPKHFPFLCYEFRIIYMMFSIIKTILLSL